MSVELVRVASEDKETMKNLLSLYIHDLSAFADDLEVNEHGVFIYEGIDLYWEKEELSPYFIRKNGKLAGFVLLNQPPYAPPDVDFYISECFVLKAYRGQGVCQASMKQLFAVHPGRYLVLQLKKNLQAIGFWHRLYDLLQIPYEEEELDFQDNACLSQKFQV